MRRLSPLPSSGPAIGLAALLLLAHVTPASAQRRRGAAGPVRNSPAVLAAFKNVVAKPSESTVRVLCDENESALGTIVAADGWIVTKASELRGNLVCKLKDGRT